MALWHKHFFGFSILFLLTLNMCTANIQSVMTTFTEKTRVATSHTTLQNISDIQCVRKCSKERQTGGCTLAGYNKATVTCYLSIDDPQDVLGTSDEMSGVFFLLTWIQHVSMTCFTAFMQKRVIIAKPEK